MLVLGDLLLLLLCVVAVVGRGGEGSAENLKYLAECSLQPTGQGIPCMKAIFLSDIAKKKTPFLPLYPTLIASSEGSELWLDFLALPTLCSIELSELQPKVKKHGFVAVARRGDCAFDTKASVAESIGASALLVLNSASQSELVPMGSGEDSFLASIPVVLGLASAFNRSSIGVVEADLAKLRISIDTRDKVTDKEQAPTSSPLIAVLSAITALVQLLVVGICLLLVKDALDSFFVHGNVTKKHLCVSMAEVQYVPVVVLLLLLFVLLRLGTLRTKGEDRSGGNAGYDYGLLAAYNHRETDEVIFEHLISKVSKNWTDYRVDVDFIRTFSLSEENYDHAVFIHPPLFVYLSAALVHFFAVPLPLIPVLLQSVAVLALWVLCREYYVLQHRILGVSSRSKTKQETHTTVSLLSQEVVCVFLLTLCIVWSCPVLWLTSQKLWIDNAVFMATTLSIAVHTWITNYVYLHHHHHTFFAWSQCVSGLFFGLCGLNCKITCLALLPCMAAYTVFVLSCEVQRASLVKVKIWLWKSVLSMSGLVLGSVAGYLPWLCYYWKHTGMLLPSAWPSATMLARFPFVRQAVLRPWHYYLTTLAAYAPLHLVGLIFIALLLGICVLKLVCGKMKWADCFTTKYRRLGMWTVFWMWPCCFAVGLTALGIAGGGYQQRFLTPMLAGTAFLSSVVICEVFLSDNKKSYTVVLVSTVVVLGLAYSLCLGWYFAVMYAPLYAEIAYGLDSMLKLIISSPYVNLQSREETQRTFEFLKHFGVKI